MNAHIQGMIIRCNNEMHSIYYAHAPKVHLAKSNIFVIFPLFDKQFHADNNLAIIYIFILFIIYIFRLFSWLNRHSVKCLIKFTFHGICKAQKNEQRMHIGVWWIVWMNESTILSFGYFWLSWINKKKTRCIALTTLFRRTVTMKILILITTILQLIFFNRTFRDVWWWCWWVVLLKNICQSLHP